MVEIINGSPKTKMNSPFTRTVSVISCDPPCKASNHRFTTVPLLYLIKYELYINVCSLKSLLFLTDFISTAGNKGIKNF